MTTASLITIELVLCRPSFDCNVPTVKKLDERLFNHLEYFIFLEGMIVPSLLGRYHLHQ